MTSIDRHMEPMPQYGDPGLYFVQRERLENGAGIARKKAGKYLHSQTGDCRRNMQETVMRCDHY